jgi:putative inorganic carbon (HCO3(-)) transporter
VNRVLGVRIAVHPLGLAWPRVGQLAGWIILVATGLALGLLPIPWAAVAVPGTIVVVATLIRPQLALYLLCFAIPFGSLFEVSRGGISIGAAEGTILLMASAWLARMIALREELSWPRLSGPLALFIGVTSLSLLNATALPFAFKEAAKWIEFLVTMLVVVNTVTPRGSVGIVAALLVAALGEALLGAYQFLTQSGPEFFVLMGRFMRAYGTFEQPNPFAGYLGLTAPLGLVLGLAVLSPASHNAAGRRDRPYQEIPAWLRWLGLGSFVASVAAIGMSWSRGAWLGLAAAVTVVVLVRSRKGAIVAALLVLLVAGIGLLGTFRLLPESMAERLTSVIPFIGVRDVRSVEVTDENYAAVERLAHWQAALDMWSARPWLGVGFGNYAAAYSQYALPKWPLALGHAHNYYLNIAAETGLLGLLTYLVLWGAALWQTVRAVIRSDGPYARALALGALGMLVHVSVHNVVDNLWVHSMYIQVAMLLGLVQIQGHQRSTFA